MTTGITEHPEQTNCKSIDLNNNRRARCLKQIPRAWVQIMDDFNEMKVISTYTTKEAVADGFLVRVPEEQSREAGIKFPVYMTRATWDKYVEVPKGMEGELDLSGRLWDILFMFAMAARRTPSNIMFYELVCRIPDTGNWESNEKSLNGESKLTRLIRLKAVIGPQDIDDPTPAIFIMEPGED